MRTMITNRKTVFSLMLQATATLSFSQVTQAGYAVYPPNIAGGFTYFEDSDNQKNADLCSKNMSNDGICVSAYTLPRGIKVAKNEAGVPMLVQGMFFKNFWSDHTVVYNITMEPDYTHFDTISSTIQMTLANKYGVNPKSVSVSPINIGAVQFVVRSTFGSSEKQISEPAVTPSPTPTPSPSSGTEIALGTTFTNTVVPKWTGDFHNIGARFSVSIVGPIWDLEPGLSNMFLNTAGNAAVGQISFGIPVKSLVSKSTVSCDLNVFQEKIQEQTKVWHITHVSRPGYTSDTVSNEEWNAIRSRLNINEFCEVSTFEDTTVTRKQFMSDRAQQMFQSMFDKTFKQVTDFTLPEIAAGKDAVYTLFRSSSSGSASGKIEISFSDEQVFLLRSDLDFYAGGVTRDNLAPESKYICQHFEKLVSYAKCEIQCDPMSEVYLPRHRRANTQGCVDITTLPLTQ